MFFLNYVYPNVCGFCENKIKLYSYACENCKAILKYYKKRIIYHNPKKYYDLMINLYEYKGIIKNSIWKFKFRNKKYIARTFSELLIENIIELNINFDIIVPVPISRLRYFERGYNQSELIAKYISKKMNKEILVDVLRKVKNNKRQSDLNAKEREKNVIGVYEAQNMQDKLTNKTILLIDDICTTGATLNECAKTLKNVDVEKIIAITIAYA